MINIMIRTVIGLTAGVCTEIFGMFYLNALIDIIAQAIIPASHFQYQN